ncbi:hypothetical protein AVEN_237424-1 [Araneus ventricosus]|uniref:Uncharacterized protein n=1 Tax=Araneus ventricosus TaxID=182803 RepID=A0A4Y2KK17_ARAVE|nr:hypothetical protein AVEN_237424-1 [Araneus ventricosus]
MACLYFSIKMGGGKNLGQMAWPSSSEWTGFTKTEGGVLIAITGHGQNPPVQGHRSGDNPTPHHYYAHQGNENPLTYPPASHPHIRGAPDGRRK